MFAIFFNTVLLFAEGGWEAFKHFYNEWFNIPGFELWKFVNLGLFIGLMVYLTKKPLTESFKAKRDAIRSELIKAEQEKQDALGELTSIEAKLAQLETEKANILQRASEEAATEKARLEEHTAAEIERHKKQSEAELGRLSHQARAELRRFSAEESVRLAEEKLRAQIDGTTDARLVRASIQEIGGLN